MPAPYGFSYAADAISRAIADSFAGANRGLQEARLENEQGIKNRAEASDQAYAPIRMKAGVLANQAAQQNMDIAAAQEGRAVQAFPLAQRLAGATATTAEAKASTAYEMATQDLITAKRNNRDLELKIQDAETRAPYLKPQLENQKKQSDLELDMAQTKFDTLKKTLAEESQANAELYGADINNPSQVLSILAKYPRVFNQPNNAYIQALDTYYRAQAAMAGKDFVNPVQTFAGKQQTIERSQNNAEQAANNAINSLIAKGTVMMGGDAGTQAVRDWFTQYNRAIQLRRASQDPSTKAMKINFTPEELAIPPMPDALVQTLSGQKPGILDRIGITSSDYPVKHDLAMRTKYYAEQGYDWTTANMKAAADAAARKTGAETPSDWVEEGALPQKGKTEAPLPPKAKTPEQESRVQTGDRNLKNELAKRYDLGSWEILQNPANIEAHDFVEKVAKLTRKYMDEYGLPMDKALAHAEQDIAVEQKNGKK